MSGLAWVAAPGEAHLYPLDLDLATLIIKIISAIVLPSLALSSLGRILADHHARPVFEGILPHMFLIVSFSYFLVVGILG